MAHAGSKHYLAIATICVGLCSCKPPAKHQEEERLELIAKAIRGDATYLRKLHIIADRGDDAAQASLGSLYAGGMGVPKDEAESANWYRKAADQGIAGAQVQLALRYVTGEGVPKDGARAYMYINLAAATDADAARIRESLASMMTPEQIAEGQRLSREWTPTSPQNRGK